MSTVIINLQNPMSCDCVIVYETVYQVIAYYTYMTESKAKSIITDTVIKE